ncbi:MAG: hypothetical protein IKV39_00705 [Clostridia bacterium]|nr:hypothetical protein [Clostridia bacterium]
MKKKIVILACVILVLSTVVTLCLINKNLEYDICELVVTNEAGESAVMEIYFKKHSIFSEKFDLEVLLDGDRFVCYEPMLFETDKPIGHESLRLIGHGLNIWELRYYEDTFTFEVKKIDVVAMESLDPIIWTGKISDLPSELFD